MNASPLNFSIDDSSLLHTNTAKNISINTTTSSAKNNEIRELESSIISACLELKNHQNHSKLNKNRRSLETLIQLYLPLDAIIKKIKTSSEKLKLSGDTNDFLISKEYKKVNQLLLEYSNDISFEKSKSLQAELKTIKINFSKTPPKKQLEFKVLTNQLVDIYKDLNKQTIKVAVCNQTLSKIK